MVDHFRNGSLHLNHSKTTKEQYNSNPMSAQEDLRLTKYPNHNKLTMFTIQERIHDGN